MLTMPSQPMRASLVRSRLTLLRVKRIIKEFLIECREALRLSMNTVMRRSMMSTLHRLIASLRSLSRSIWVRWVSAISLLHVCCRFNRSSRSIYRMRKVRLRHSLLRLRGIWVIRSLVGQSRHHQLPQATESARLWALFLTRAVKDTVKADLLTNRRSNWVSCKMIKAHLKEDRLINCLTPLKTMQWWSERYKNLKLSSLKNSSLRLSILIARRYRERKLIRSSS